MRYVRLGKAELEVSAIAFGTWAFGGDWGSFDAHESKAAIHHALDLGVTFFDTAQAYGFGVSERLLADALWERVRRDEVIVATKGGLRMEGQTLLRDASGRWLRQGAESSLRNLHTDYIDLYQVHWPDPRTPPEETARVLEDLVREGKIRHVGVSNYDAKQMDELARHGRLETVPRHRGAYPALHGRARHRCARLRPARPRAALGPHDAGDEIPSRRLAEPQLRFHGEVVPGRTCT